MEWLLVGGATGAVVEVGPAGPPTATEETIKNIYKNSQHTPPQMWVGFQPHEATTPATADGTITRAGASGEGYRGALYSSPFPASAGDWFWDRAGHGWEYRASTFFRHVSFEDLKIDAMNSAGDALFFGANDVFLNEVASANQAARIIDNAGGTESDVQYWAIVAGSLEEITDFVAAVGPEDLYDFVPINELGGTIGNVVDVGGEGPPTANPETIKDVYKNSESDPPRVWIGYEKHEAGTRASGSGTNVAYGSDGEGFRGVLFNNPSPASVGDWYWDKTAHGWAYWAVAGGVIRAYLVYGTESSCHERCW